MILVTIINNNLESLIPIIHEFSDKTSKHILFFDNSNLEIELANNLKNSIENENSNTEVELIKIDEDSKKDIDSIKEKLQKYGKSTYLNAAQSDTSLVVVLSNYILDSGGYVLAYDKFENTYNKISKDNFSNHKIERNLTIDSFINYMGYRKISENSIEKAKKYESHLNFVFKNSNNFFFSEYLIKKNRIKELDVKTKNAFVGLNILDKDYNYIRKESFGNLFEYFIFSKLQQYNFDDIKIGVEVEFAQNIENEFDILAIRNNHMYAIECKLGAIVSDSNSIIYKLDSLIENFGEDSKGLIVNIHPTEDVYNNRVFINKLFSQKARKRAQYNNLEVYNDYRFNEIEFNEIVEDFFEATLNSKKELKDEPLFLLGGRDLEMLEIKNILIKNNKHYLDKKLSWGAKLSHYIHLLDKKREYYGIELIEDVEPPEKYKAIDHHNDLQNRPSSIEQVADILGISLNRYQMLVALNDKGYIPAMQEYGATEVEIELIRQKDREAQGVTKQDELLADISIQEAHTINGVFTIKAHTDKFSAIVDKCYGKHSKILIYNDKKLTYYGDGVKKIVSKYQKAIKSNRAYYGGNNGFFGISENIYPKKEIDRIKKDILKIVAQR